MSAPGDLPRRLDSPPEPHPRVDELAERVARLELVVADLIAKGAGRRPLNETDARRFEELAPVLQEAFCGRTIFYSGMAIDAARAAPALLAAAGQPPSARRLGKFLRRCVGHRVNGLSLELAGADSAGLLFVWVPGGGFFGIETHRGP